MPKLTETNEAIELMHDQLNRAGYLGTEHIQILASNKGRFAHDKFNIFHHELQLRIALETDAIDVDYAREKIRTYAENEINMILTKEIIKKHVPAIHTQVGKRASERMAEDNLIAAINSKRNLDAIRKLRA